MYWKKKSKIPVINKNLNYIENNVILLFEVQKNTESKNPKVVRTKNGGIVLLSKCSVCNSKKLKFLTEQEARGVLSNFSGVKVLILSYTPILNTLF